MYNIKNVSYNIIIIIINYILMCNASRGFRNAIFQRK